MAAAVGRFGEQKHILIQAKFSLINEDNKYIKKVLATGRLGFMK